MKCELMYKNAPSVNEMARIIRLSRGAKLFSSEALPRSTDKKDLQTVQNCYRSGHMSVFEFVDFTFAVQAPIYVARQLFRYRRGSYLERSLRYCDPLTVICDVDASLSGDYYEALNRYQTLIKAGLKKEEARKVLPTFTPTQFYVKYDARELFHIFDERLNSTAQSETRELVKMMYYEVNDATPWIIDVYNSKCAK